MGVIARTLDSIDRLAARFDQTVQRIGRRRPPVRKGFEPGSSTSIRKQWGYAKLDLDQAQLTKPYCQHPWVYAAVSKYNDHIKALPWRLKQGRTTEGAREIEDGPLYSVLNRPNALWSGSDLKEATITRLLTTGNAVWLLDRENYRADPEEIWCLPHWLFEPHFVKGTWNVDYWVMKTPDGAKRLNIPPWTVAFFRLFGPYELFWGQNPLDAAEKSLAQDWNAILFNEAFFRNGAVPGGILTFSKEAGKKQLRQYKEFFRDEYQGVFRAFKAMTVGEGVADYKPHQISHHDMHFEGLRHMTREEIAGVLKVPPSIMGWKEQTHKATQEKELRDWISGPVRGLCTVIEESLRAQFFFPYDSEYTWLEFDFSNVAALQEDEGERVNRAATMFGWGVPVEELNRRFDLGLEAYEGWDQSLLPITLLPRGTDLTAGPGAAPAEPPTKLYSIPSDRAWLPKSDHHTQPPRLIAATESRIVTRPHTPAELALWSQWVAKTYPIERAFNGQLRNYLLKARRWFEKNLTAAAGPEDFLADVLKEVPRDWIELPASFDDELAAIGRRHFHKIAEDVGPLIEQHIRAARLPFSFDIGDARIANFLKTKEIKIVQVNRGIRESVRGAVENMLRDHRTIADLQDKVFGIMGDSRARSLRIARTETAQTANGLENVSEKLAGVKTHQWLAARDEVTRVTHLENMALGPWPITKQYPNGCMYAGDINGGAGETVNCRCSMIAVE